MNENENLTTIEKLSTGIAGLDHIAGGGLPRGRATLVAGSAGSAKTVLAVQFLIEGINRSGENGVFVTFEESPEDIRRNMLGFGWDIASLERERKWKFVDASMQSDFETVEVGTYDLGALIARIENAMIEIDAKRLSLDSLGAVFGQFERQDIVRRELHRIVTAFKRMGITALLTSERVDEYGEIARFGVEEFVSDNVIILRNVLEDEKRRRTIEILKFRGTTHNKGEYPFTIIPGDGMVIIPLSELEMLQTSSSERITSGNEVLDRICGGGFFRDAIVLVSGATGTGKTLLTTEFIAGGAAKGERCLLFAFEESREQLYRNASGWSVDFSQMVEEGTLKVVCSYPEVMGLEDRLISMQEEIRSFQPNRIAIDSLSALERVSTRKGFREFVIAITSLIKHHNTSGLFTSTAPSLLGGTSVTEAHISTITDSIILMRYVEIFGEMRRGLTVLKMRGSMHEKEIREYVIDDKGMHIGAPFKNVTGILSGKPVQMSQRDMERLDVMFDHGDVQ